MNGLEMTEAGTNPFSPRAVLALVLLGAAVFVALLWMIGAGMTSGSTNDGGAHAGGKGLNGYAALADLLERRGHAVRRSRSEGAFDKPGLLVLTPPHNADADDITQAIRQHRHAGPTLLILPKWFAVAVPPTMRGKTAKEGWVMLGGAAPPLWADGLSDIGELDVRQAPAAGSGGHWQGLGRGGGLPDAKAVQSLASGRVIPLVRDGSGQALAGYLDDGAANQALDELAGIEPADDDSGAYPVVIVAEPDLLDNYGFADRERAMLALALIDAALDGEDMPISFDLTLNGHARSTNLLTLAFTPPFLAATLCLLLAALVAGWRAFLRFGPPRKAARAIAFGKRALVANAAGLLRRTRRLHLIAPAYTAAARERLARALALPRGTDADATDAAIDRALAARHAGGASFRAITARLRQARGAHDILKAARDLHSLERTLTR